MLNWMYCAWCVLLCDWDPRAAGWWLHEIARKRSILFSWYRPDESEVMYVCA